MARTYIGARLRRLREDLGLPQNQFAERLGISASYLNQLERDQRPLTGPMLLRITDLFGDQLTLPTEEEELRLAGELQEVAADLDGRLSAGDIAHLVASQPELAEAVVDLHRRYRGAADQLAALTSGLSAGDRALHLERMPFEMVRDFFYEHHNHFGALDTAAESFAQGNGLVDGEMEADLVEHLEQAHGVRVVLDRPGGGQAPADDLRRFEAGRAELRLSARSSSGQRAYQLATQIAFLEHDALIDELVTSSSLPTEESVALARIGLANHFAAAVLMPYGRFLQAAEEHRYDIELLAERFGVSFETTCHRLASLQRPGARGVPFLFVRVDQAGNISKRQSATDFHFSRIGGSCPLWVVHEAFGWPGRIQRQVAEMPDGRQHLWVARTSEQRSGGWGRPRKRFALGLGCDVRHADRVVYGDGIDLRNPTAVTPIGAGCKVCDRPACPQRAFPPAGRPLDIDERESHYVPYRFR